MVQVRASAYDESGQYWIHEVFIQVTNWEGTISSFLIYNYKPLIDAIKLGIAVDSKLRLSMSNLKNADSVRFTATNAITGSHKNSWDNDFSDGISADLAIPTGFYKITATPYSYGNEMTTTLVGWLIFIRS
jgi:hypothetical protein